MTRRLVYIILIATGLVVMLVQPGLAQSTGNISGLVFSRTSQEALANATLQLVTPTKDSIVKRSAVADSSGRFVLAKVPLGDYRLVVRVLGYRPAGFFVRLSSGKRDWVMDTLFLESDYTNVNGIMIVAKRPPVVVKPDTTEFSAGSISVRKNATVEDMFQKVPGLEVDKSGAVKAQGEAVTQIYVDGKPFFGADLQAVTRNFPADIIDKIQIIDKRSDQALATKVDDGKRVKIINITLKKNRAQGIFGTDYAGYGTDDRYDVRLMTNVFNKARKLSVIAGGTNTNLNGGPVSDNKQLKANFADKVGKVFDYNVYLDYDRNRTEQQQQTDRQNVFTDSSNFYGEVSRSQSGSDVVNGGVYATLRPDSLTVIRFNENVTYNKSTNAQLLDFATMLADGSKLNDGNRSYTSTSKAHSVGGQVSLTRSFKKSGRSLFLSFGHGFHSSNADGFNLSTNHFYPPDSTTYSILQNQLQRNDNNNQQINTGVSYAEPMGQHGNLSASYNYDHGNNETPRRVYDYDTVTHGYDLFNDSLSNHFNNLNTNQTVVLNYNYGGKKVGFGTGVRWQQIVVHGESVGKDSSYGQTNSSITPNASLYLNGKGLRFNLYYFYDVQAPQAAQLQPVLDNTDPLYLKLGNPELKSSSTHSFRYNVNYYNAKREAGVNSSSGVTLISKSISSSNTYDNATGKQVSMPVNVDGTWNWSSWLSYFSPLYICKQKIKWRVNVSASGSRNVSLLNGVVNVTQHNAARLFLGMNYDGPKWIDARADVGVSRQAQDYSQQPALSNRSYVVEFIPNVTFMLPTMTEINIDFSYRQTSGQAAGFNTKISTLNADVVQYFSKKRNVWLKLKGVDLLNQNVHVWRSTGDNFIQDTRMANLLSRFVLLSLNIRINHFLAESHGGQEAGVHGM